MFGAIGLCVYLVVYNLIEVVVFVNFGTTALVIVFLIDKRTSALGLGLGERYCRLLTMPICR